MILRWIFLGSMLPLITAPASAQSVGEHLSFVACPIIRDTKNVPCWLSDYEGTRYYLTIQTDISGRVHPPYLGHKALVEGIVTDETLCGGVVLADVHISPLPELAPECNEELPRESRFDLPFTPPRPPGPSAGSLAFGSIQGPEQLDKVPPVEGAPTFEVPFRFDATLGSTHPQYLIPAYDAALAMGARRVEVTGYRGGALLTNGTMLLERPDIGRLRATQVGQALEEALNGAGLKDVAVIVRAEDAAEPDGIEDWVERRAIVRVFP